MATERGSDAGTRRAPASMTLRVLRTVDELREAADELNELRRKLGCHSPNTAPERIAATVASLPEARPEIVIACEHGQPVGCLIGRISPRRIACRLAYFRPKTPVLKCFDVVYGGFAAQTPDAAQGLLSHVQAGLDSGEYDYVMFNRLPVESSRYSIVSSKKRAIIEPPVVHWRATLRDPVSGEVRRLMSGKSRNTQRRKCRKLRDHFDGAMEVFIAERPHDCDRFVRESVRVASKSYQAALGVGIRDDGAWPGIVRAAASEGTLRSYVLFGGDEPLAYILGFVEDNVFYLEATGYRAQFAPHSPGAVLLWECVEDLRQFGVSALDFGFGDAEYKRTYAEESWPESTICMYGRSAKARLGSAIDRSCRTASGMAGRLARSSGVFRRVKNSWRRRLESDA